MSHNNPTGIPPNIAGATFNQWGMGENGQHQPLFLWRDGSAAVPVRFLRGTPASPERGCPQRWPALSLLHWLFLLPSLTLCSLFPTSWDHPPNHQNPSPHLGLRLEEPKLWPPATLEPCSESHWVLCRITGLVTLPCGYRTRRAVKARTTSVSFTLVPQGPDMLAERMPAIHLLPMHREGQEAALGFFDSENTFLFQKSL